MDVPLNLDFVQKLSDPPWSSLEHVAGNPSAMLVHDGGNSAAIHDVSKSHGRRAGAIAGLRPIYREVQLDSTREMEVQCLSDIMTTSGHGQKIVTGR